MRKLGFTGFEWDEGNRKKCQKHGVPTAEIEYVLAQAEALILPDAKGIRGESRFLAIGRTRLRRYAFVVFTRRERASGTWLRPISARYMHEREIRKYEQEIALAKERQGSGRTPR